MYIKKNHADSNPDTIKEPIYNVSLDEMSECQIYDAGSTVEKADLTQKRVRKVFQGEPITVKMIMRNPLLIDISIRKVCIHCEYKEEESESVDLSQSTQDLKSEEFEVDMKDLDFAGL